VKPLIEITSLLNHGDRQRLNWFTDTPQIIRLIRLFAFFSIVFGGLSPPPWASRA